MADMLTIQQRNNLALFQEVSGIQDEQLGIELLTQHNWDVQSVITEYALHGEDLTEAEQERQPLNPRHRDNINTNDVIENGTRTLPTANYVVNIFKWIFSAQRIPSNPDSDTRRFIDTVTLKYRNLPIMFDRSYQSAVRHAFQNSKFLLVYLHSEMHDATDSFCREVLSSTNVSRFFNENFIFWGGSVYDPEGFSLTYQLKCKTFPFLCVLLCQSETIVQIADIIQGTMTANSLLEKLQLGQITYGGILADVRQNVARRSETTSLREQQDREYVESMERDRLMRETAEQERRLEEENLRLQRDAEQQRVQQEELQRAMELSASLNRENEVSLLRQRLAAEPTDASDTEHISQIRFQLPRGGKLSRKFYKSDTIQAIHDYLDIYFFDNQNDVKSFSVSTNYPKRELSNEKHITIEEAGLHPRGMLFVQDLDA